MSLNQTQVLKLPAWGESILTGGSTKYSEKCENSTPRAGV